jgi:phenylacetate 2-hydroxylase
LLQNSNNDIEQAWDDSAKNMDCHFVLALINETLRYFTVLPLSLPRATTKAIDFTTSQKQSLTLPAGTIVFMNAYAANHDESVFDSPYLFLPDRWLDNGKLDSSLKHFAFGAGSRKCSGNSLALQQLYTLTCRMVLAFKIRRPVSNSLMELDPFRNNLDSASISFTPKLFKVQLKPRIHNGSDKLYYKIMRS